MRIKNEEYAQYVTRMVPPAAETAGEHHDREHTEPEFPEQDGVHDNAPVHICIVHGCGETLFKAYDRVSYLAQKRIRIPKSHLKLPNYYYPSFSQGFLYYVICRNVGHVSITGRWFLWTLVKGCIIDFVKR